MNPRKARQKARAAASILGAAGHLGRVRIDFRRYRYRHYKNTFWAWSAVRAVKEPQPPAAAPASVCQSR